jgi:WD40 repeat protein
VTVAGGHGMGKTRLAAELASEAHRDGATVLYVRGARTPEAAPAAIAAAREAIGPTLLVLEDALDAGGDVRSALGRIAGELRSVAALMLVTGRDATALAGLRPSGSLVLEPLDAAAVRQIAVLYAPAGIAAVPVAALLETSGGVPRRVHEAASEWARREATRRVETVARRAAAGRTRARALEVELAGTVVDLQSARERTGQVARDGVDGARPVICPYKGLAPFEADDADYFFGREQLVAGLVARLVGAPLLAVVGASGSGKSSVIRAGLLPALTGGILPGSERWGSELTRPGEHPRLARGRFRGERRAVLVVDQFEELFTACADERERAAFVEALVRAALDPEDGRVVVLAVRADFYGRCADHPRLSALMGANHVLVGPLSHDELRRAIELPARRAGLQLEPGLADRLIADCEGEPGALPLLSSSLLELWQQRAGTQLRLAGYERSGGVRGAVARLAEAAYERLGQEQRPVARNILLRLADDGNEGAPVRRRVALAELDACAHDVLEVLVGSRLVTIEEGTVEVAHEALLREWPRLRRWLAEDRDGRRLHRHLRQAALEWDAGGRDPAELYRGARLASALEWRAQHEPELNATEQQFLSAARAAGDRARRRMQLVLAGILALLVLATAAALLALDQRGQARDEARAAEAQRLGAQALNEEALDRALLLARQGVALDDSPAARDNLLDALRRVPAATAVVSSGGDAVTSVALHPDGRALAVGDDDGRVVFVDALTRRRIGEPRQHQPPAGITSLAFSPDGERFVSAGWDLTGSFVDLFDGRTGRFVTRLGGSELTYVEAPTVHFSPDSRVLAVRAVEDASTRIVRWDARTGRRLGVRTLPGVAPALLGFAGSGELLVTTGGEGDTTVIHDAVTLRPLRRFGVSGPVAALSPAARLVAFGARGGSIRLLDLDTGALRTARGRHEGPVVALRFDPGGERLVSAGRDGRLIVWDAERATALESLAARGIGPIRDLAVARDGSTAYSAGRDGTVIAWDLAGARRWERPFGAARARRLPRSLGVTADGSRFVVVEAGGSVELVDSGTLRMTGRIRPRRGPASGAALAPDGATLAVTTQAGELEFWDARTRRPLGEPQIAHAGSPPEVAFSADGRWLATGGDHAIVRVWDARRRTGVGSVVLGHAADLSFSPDGTLLAVTIMHANFAGGLEIRSAPDLELIRTVPVPIGTVGRFTRNGRSLVYGARDGRVFTIDTETWRPRGDPVRARASILSADLSPDGRLLATTSTDGSGRLWDVASGRPVGSALSGGRGDPIDAAFIGRGSRLAVLHHDAGFAWDVRPGTWTRHACAVAGRALTRAEWEAALPQREYAPACVPG